MRYARTRYVMVMIAILLVSAITIGLPRVNASRQASLDSGALGLTRAEVEALWGAPTETIEQLGQPAYDDAYVYGTAEGVANVFYREIDGEAIAVALEFSWLGDGVSEEIATATVADLLPSDATLTERFVAPATPDNTVALISHRYVSESLGEAFDGGLASELLVIHREPWVEAFESSTITSVTIMIREPMQPTA